MGAKFKPLAHSSRNSIPAQTYAEHTAGVRSRAKANARRAASYLTEGKEHFIEAVTFSGEYHDLGKLDDKNQEVLRSKSRDKLPVNHSDAGTAHLCRLNRRESALFVYGHHCGLFSYEDEFGKGEKFLRDPGVYKRTDAMLENYLDLHGRCIESKVSENTSEQPEWGGLARRIGLSSLV